MTIDLDLADCSPADCGFDDAMPLGIVPRIIEWPISHHYEMNSHHHENAAPAEVTVCSTADCSTADANHNRPTKRSRFAS